jgi:anthranilate synthase/aminodeoxychorismate synthase-like glutamine amidotransferase
MVKVLLIDNYDSFVHNIAQYLGEMGAEVIVMRNDVTYEDVKGIEPDRIVLSPGPGHPTDSGICLKILQILAKEVPTLGVCLGHQALVHEYGGKIVRAKELIHGKTSEIHHEGEGLFKRIPTPFSATRYHSLIAENGKSVPDCLDITARTEDGIIMAVQHKQYPIHGLQFHPESILTQYGRDILRNFLEGEQ